MMTSPEINYNIFMEIILTSAADPFVCLLLSDTHLSFRRSRLPETVLREFRSISPDLILHCGDICTAACLDQLRAIAPLYAVRGNRDILRWFSLPPAVDLNINGFRIHMEHGEGPFFRYLRSKSYITFCRLFSRPTDYTRVVRIPENFREYDLCCFGHSHARYMELRDGTILLNPGHMDPTGANRDYPEHSFAVLRIFREKIVIESDIMAEDGTRKSEKRFLRKIRNWYNSCTDKDITYV